MLPFDDLFLFIKSHCVHGDPVLDDQCTPKGMKIHAADLLAICRILHQHENTFFDMLSCVTALDNGPEAKTMEMIYNLYSIPYDKHLTLKISIPRENPVVDSVVSVWKTADWHEREAFDMFGINFTGHGDLRRILMPADWEGYPLRKDYKQQAYYRDIKLDY